MIAWLSVTRLGRFARWHWPDGNPLRRPSDRVESAILTALFAGFFAAAPFVGQTCGALVHAVAEHAQWAQQATRQKIPAVLLKPATETLMSPSPDVDIAQAWARWTAPDGRVVTAGVLAGPDAAAGTTVRVWVTRDGQLTRPPLQDSQVSGQAQLAAVLGIVGLAVVLIVIGALVRCMLDKQRMALWDAAWLVTGPRWTRRA